MNLSRKVAIKLAESCEYHSTACHLCINRKSNNLNMPCCAYCLDLHDCQLLCICPIIKQANEDFCNNPT